MDTVYGPNDSGQWTPKAFSKQQPRYLWTDAFGLVNYLTLYVQTQNTQYLNQAMILMSDVHNTLGRTRDGKQRLGNSSIDHPIKNGLRIGKTENESASMDGDGQYFHYNTKWMFALNRLSFICKDPKYNQWAMEMAKCIFPKFVHWGKMPRMCWKMSIDLSETLVPSEGNLDPLDGYVTYKLLQEVAVALDDTNRVDLSKEIAIFKQMVDAKVPLYDSHDALDLGEACWLSHWYLQNY